jgi:hypothetical protein
VGGSHWPLLQPAYISLAAAAVAGDADVAAALLLGFPDLAAALGPGPTRAVLVPVMLELLHSQLVRRVMLCLLHLKCVITVCWAGLSKSGSSTGQGACCAGTGDAA